MATTTDMAPARRKTTTNNNKSSASPSGEQELESQISQLQSDLKSITETLSKLTGE